MRLDVLGLEAFIWIAEFASFRRAAAHLQISQTAVSHRLSKFEESLGFPLFRRTTRLVLLTPAGLDFLPIGRSLLQEFEQKLQLFRARHTDRADELAIAFVPTIATHLLPAVFAEFSKKRPDAKMQVFDRSAVDVGDMVAKGQAEFGVTLLGPNRWDHETQPLQKEEFFFVCPSSHRLARKKIVRWREIGELPLVRFSMPTINRVIMDTALESHKDGINWRYEVQHAMTALSLVQSGLACAAVPRLALQSLPEGVSEVQLTAPSISRTIGIVRRRGERSSELGSLFQDLLCKLTHTNGA